MTEEAQQLQDYDETQAVHQPAPQGFGSASSNPVVVPSQEFPSQQPASPRPQPNTCSFSFTTPPPRPQPDPFSTPVAQQPVAQQTPATEPRPVVPRLSLAGVLPPPTKTISERKLPRIGDNTARDYDGYYSNNNNSVEIEVDHSPNHPRFKFRSGQDFADTIKKRGDAMTKAIQDKQAVKDFKSMSKIGRLGNKLIKSASVASSAVTDTEGHLSRAMQAYKDKKAQDKLLREKIEREADPEMIGLLQDLQGEREKTAGIAGFTENINRKRKRGNEQDQRQEQEILDTVRSTTSNETTVLEGRFQKLKGG